MSSDTNPVVYLDMKYGEMRAGRVIIELYADLVPNGAENFRALCTGEKGIGKRGKPLHYKGTRILKVIPMCMVQGGDIENNNGSGGESIYGDAFNDECLTIGHEKPGMVGMMNRGPNSNQSQFYITTQPCTHLDDTNMVVGRVLQGLNVIVEMSDYNRDDTKTPEPLIIEDCGELKPGEPWNLNEDDGTEDVFPPWPDDWDEYSTADVERVKQTVLDIKNSGNIYYGRHDFVNAERKYSKCMRYIDWYNGQNRKSTALADIRGIVMLNLAAALLKRHKYKETVKFCNEVLKINANTTKALYRRAQALMAMKEYDKALVDLKKALAACPNDRNIIHVFNTVRRHKYIYLQDEKSFYSNIFK